MALHIKKNTEKALDKRGIVPRLCDKKIIEATDYLYDNFTKEDLEDGITYYIEDGGSYCSSTVYCKYKREETDQEFCSRLIKEYDAKKKIERHISKVIKLNNG